MTTSRLKKLPIGISDWNAIREQNLFYVDKTAKLAALVSDQRKVFFARPDGMGKTLLCSMLKELFTHGTQNFEGTAIYSLWPVKRRYQVIHMPFIALQGEDFEVALKAELIADFCAVGFEQAQSLDYSLPLSTFLTRLDEIAGEKQLVFLIDDWDKPLTRALMKHDLSQGRTEFNHVLTILQVFYGWLSRRKHTRFLFITGVMRFGTERLLVGDNIKDLGMMPRFSDLLGISDYELEAYEPYVKRAAKMMDLGTIMLHFKLAKNYKGFCFDYDAHTQLYRPYVLNKFLRPTTSSLRRDAAPPYFGSHWTVNGGAMVALHDFLLRRKPTVAQVMQLCASEITLEPSDFMVPTDYDTITLRQILVQTGLLSIKKLAAGAAQARPAARSFIGGITNYDVANQLIPILMEYVLGLDSSKVRTTMRQAQEALVSGNIALVCAKLNKLLWHLPDDALGSKLLPSYRFLPEFNS